MRRGRQFEQEYSASPACRASVHRCAAVTACLGLMGLALPQGPGRRAQFGHTLCPALGRIGGAQAEQHVSHIPRPLCALQVLFVSSCLQYNHLKSAARAVEQWGLRSEFPDVEADYKRKTLERLAGKGLWGVAATYVGDDRQLQVRVWGACMWEGAGGFGVHAW